MPVDNGTVSLATSNVSVMPVGGVQVALVANAWIVTTMVSATVVVTLGVACVSPLGVFAPDSTLIGVVRSTPVKLMMPPAEPAEVENDHVYDAGSLAVAVLRYMASELCVLLLLSMRRTSVHPVGAVIVAVSGRTAIAASMTSFVAVPAGLLVVRGSTPPAGPAPP